MASFDREETIVKITDIVTGKIGIDKELVTMQSTLQDLGADSLDLLEIIMRLEEQFGLEISDEDAEKMQTVEEVVNYIHERRTK